MIDPSEIIVTSDISVIGKVSAWACYIKSGDDVIKLAREFKQRTPSSQAELKAMINAVHIVDMLYGIKGKRLKIYCDNASVINVPTRKDNGEPRKRGLERFKIIEEHLTPYVSKAESYEIIWIPGHKLADTPRPIRIMHSWCDKESRRIARKHTLVPSKSS